MAQFSKKSLEKLETCHIDIQTVMKEAIKYFDFTVIEGYRSLERQFELYKKGRKQIDSGDWIVYDKKKVVTNIDGYKKKGKHNYDPSLAVDIAPYPELWKASNERFIYMIGIVMGIAKMFKDRGIIDNVIETGIDWDNDNYINDHSWIDKPHFQID